MSKYNSISKYDPNTKSNTPGIDDNNRWEVIEPEEFQDLNEYLYQSKYILTKHCIYYIMYYGTINAFCKFRFNRSQGVWQVSKYEKYTDWRS